MSASTQNQALCAIQFLCRKVLGMNLEGLSLAVRVKRGTCLPAVLSAPETAALLGAMRGTPRLMAGLTYGGGLRVSECCELRVTDIDFDQGLVRARREWQHGSIDTAAPRSVFAAPRRGRCVRMPSP